MPKIKQLTVRATNRPGALARIAEALAKNKVNITGLDASGAQGQIRLLVSNPTRAVKALKQAKIPARLEDVVLLNLADRPGTLARAASKLAKAGVNINYAYGTVVRGGRRAAIVIGVSDATRGSRLVG
ncbi:MAG: ACT domain-containing protein [Acidobacteria bacterium]|nr:ACT domain-containing protein [Acidobacteriota bacterium]